MALGQFIARPQFYGTELGRAWAHIFWLGLLLLLGSLLTWFTRYIAHHKNPRVVNAGKRQALGVLCITSLVGAATIIAMIMGNDALTGYDGDARRGIFVIWLLLLVTFTIINLATLLFRQMRQKNSSNNI